MTAAHADSTALELVRRYWQLMASNDFASVASVLADDFTMEWPQSSERIRGIERYVQMNVDYPAYGPWQFTIHRLFGDAGDVVSDVSVSDGVQSARALSFFSIRDGRIVRLVEFWPEPYAAPEHRRHLVEPMVGDAGEP